MKTISQYLTEVGLTPEEVAATQADEPSRWESDLVEAAVADYLDPATAARRAKRSGPGVERAAKIHAARVAWLEDRK